MNLKKMLLLVGAALALVAFAAPGAAQAHCLTENEECIGEGAKVTLTSTNLVTHTALGTLTCGKVTLHYTVETNNNEHLALEPVNIKHPSGEVTPTTNATTENCVLHTGGSTGATHPADITAAGTDTVTYNTWGTAEAVSKYTAKITFTGGGSITCTFTGSVHNQSTNGTSNVTIGPSTLNGGLCGNGVIEGSGTVETPNETPLVADVEPT
jgi:hypothetical protein